MRKTIKQYTPYIALLIISCVVVLLFRSIYTWYNNTHYSNVCYVDTVTDTEVLMIDCCGDVWAVDSVDGVKVGDIVDVYFYNNGTTYTHTDDIITHVRIL